MCCIDLNCDLGESFGEFKIGNDVELMKYISSANIACGFHAGDPAVMKKTVQMALLNGVSIGAHPGLQDLAGFGRREMNLSQEDAYNITIYQIGALYGFVKAEGAHLNHVKPHGALYNMCAINPLLADAVAKAVYDVNPELILYGLSNSALVIAGEKLGLRTANEVFADRTYQNDGSLTPRSRDNAVIKDKDLSIKQVLKMVKEKKVITVEGQEITINPDTVCLHGDGEHAVNFVRALTEMFEKEGITVKSLANNF